jgi:hypothetical protein
MKVILIIIASSFLLSSCGDKNEIQRNKFNDPYKRKESDGIEYWYYWKGITFTESGGTFNSTKIYHIGDQTKGDDGTVIEVTSEGVLLK